MQSDQESVLEEFMQRSFGAQFLFIPMKYKKGTAHREPADLAWVTKELVILFYLRSSSESLEDQIAHNRNQAAGYHRMWSSGKMAYALRGRNRFGDECFSPYEKTRINITLLVTSKNCGPHFVQPLSSDAVTATIVIPDKLIHWVAEFGGTIVDLLHLIDIYQFNFSHLAPSSDQAFESILHLTREYVEQSVANADPERIYLSGSSRLDYLFIFEHLSKMKLSATSGRAINDKKGREQIASLFGDFMLGEYASIAAGAEKAIRASEPPTFKKWVVLKILGHYYSFVIGTVHMGSNNVIEATNAALDASKAGSGEQESILIQYGNVLDANEYRAPLMFALPKTLPRKHSIILAERMVNRSKNDARLIN